MKTTSNFRLSKRTKTIMSLVKFTDKEQRAAFKKMMCEAESVIRASAVRERK
jgi:hypothetical protein